MKRAAFYFDVNKLSDGELADLLHELNDELGKRRSKYGGLKGQMEACALSVRSWGTAQQNAMKGCL